MADVVERAGGSLALEPSSAFVAFRDVPGGPARPATLAPPRDWSDLGIDPLDTAAFSAAGWAPHAVPAGDADAFISDLMESLGQTDREPMSRHLRRVYRVLGAGGVEEELVLDTPLVHAKLVGDPDGLAAGQALRDEGILAWRRIAPQTGWYALEYDPRVNPFTKARDLRQSQPALVAAAHPGLRFRTVEMAPTLPGIPCADPGWHLERLGLEALRDKADGGAGIEVVVLDSYISVHDAYKDRVVSTARIEDAISTAGALHEGGTEHGTKSAGIVGAQSASVSGVAPKASLRLVTMGPTASDGDWEEAFRYLGELPFSVLTASVWPDRHGTMGMSAYPALQSMLKLRKEDTPLLFMCADNNPGANTDDSIFLSHPSITVVSQVNSADTWRPCMSGKAVAFAAPTGVCTTTGTIGYGDAYGTSAATPVAAGVGALLVGASRAMSVTLSAPDARALLQQRCGNIQYEGVTHPGGTHDDRWGHGRLSATTLTTDLCLRKERGPIGRLLAPLLCRLPKLLSGSAG